MQLTLIARRFREFINFSAYLDVRPNDDIIDILGFLAFEMVRSLCVTALEVREQLEKSGTSVATTARGAPVSPVKRKAAGGDNSPAKRPRVDGVTSPDESATPGGAPGADNVNSNGRRYTQSGNPLPRSLFAPPPSARQPLLPSHVLEAFAQIQRKQTSNRIGGLRNWRGGMSRGRVALV